MCNEILKTIGFREEKEIYSSKKDGEIIYNPLFNLHNVPELIEKFCNSCQTNYLLFRTNTIKNQISDYLFSNSNIVFGVLGSNRGRWSKRFLSVCNALNKIMLNKDLKQEEVEYLFDVLPTKICLEYGAKKRIKDSSQTKIFKTYEVLEMTKLWKQQKDLLNFDKSDNNSQIKEQMIKFLEYVKVKDNQTKAIKMNEIYKHKLNVVDYIINFREDEEDKVLEYNTMLGTFHSAKGLEADNIFVFLGTSNYFKDINDSEKRCFYVASSRPKERIFFLGTMSDQKAHLEEEFRDIIRRYRTG